MRGFGSPDSFAPATTATTHFSRGFGVPDGAVEAWGFGDPASAATVAITVVGIPSTSSTGETIINFQWPDDGGEIIQLTGTWPITKPYRIRLIQSFTGQVYPDSIVGCTAPLDLEKQSTVIPRDNQFWCYTDEKKKELGDPTTPVAGEFLSFILPQLPTGLYDIEISWNIQIDPYPEADSADWNFGALPNSITLDRALQVIHRNRSHTVWRLRNNFPSVFSVGARTPKMETILGEDT
jgi:hypothetical protein